MNAPQSATGAQQGPECISARIMKRIATRANLRGEGFRGQVLHFGPADLRRQIARHPLGGGLCVPDIGWFPKALGHYRERPQGADEHILIYCHAGGGWFEIDGQRREVSAGQALLVPSGKPHRYGADEAQPWSIYWAHFSGQAAAVYASHFIPQGYVVPVLPTAGKQVERLFKECFHALGDGHTLAGLLQVAHIFRHLLGVLLFENVSFHAEATAMPMRDFTGNIQFMRDNISRSLSLQELAQQAGLSPSRYSALFKARTGVSPVEHHIALRIQAACRLLITTNWSVKEVSYAIGHEDPFYFSRLFVKIMGVSPSAYRGDAKG
ncbi:AraC family transcriptional regulator [Luteolibacter arcticus]|uniref:AraC family transcriptional regulator n=1 Tax=Luteolibacter arcticus TaxID=1581411 RepID=A0ABT3GK70_9BACT|nr:AraC family transcriptional regulator [Luteolibacter arcticus]MCW1923918.1 AraC family transcriptional regulator [Luteolibacter arcticus]